MKENILGFINKLEGFKTAIKNLHWSSANMSEHKLFDDIASSVSDFQDEIAEIEQGMHGQIDKNELKAEEYTINGDKVFLNDLKDATNDFYKTIDGDEYVGMRSVVEAFLGDVNKYIYLLNLCLKEDIKTRLNKNQLKESMKLDYNKLHEVVLESVKAILRESIEESIPKSSDLKGQKTFENFKMMVDSINDKLQSLKNEFGSFSLIDREGNIYDLPNGIMFGANGMMKIVTSSYGRKDVDIFKVFTRSGGRYKFNTEDDWSKGNSIEAKKALRAIQNDIARGEKDLREFDPEWDDQPQMRREFNKQLGIKREFR